MGVSARLRNVRRQRQGAASLQVRRIFYCIVLAALGERSLPEKASNCPLKTLQREEKDRPHNSVIAIASSKAVILRRCANQFPIAQLGVAGLLVTGALASRSHRAGCCVTPSCRPACEQKTRAGRATLAVYTSPALATHHYLLFELRLFGTPSGR
jgi:hypothetical protein